jgi:hypothetical protein
LLFHDLNRGAGAKHARGTIRRMNTTMVSGVHGDGRRVRVVATFLATAERSAAGRLADASPMSSKTRRTIRMSTVRGEARRLRVAAALLAAVS